MHLDPFERACDHDLAGRVVVGDPHAFYVRAGGLRFSVLQTEDVGPPDPVALAVSMPKRPDGAIRTERSTRGRPSLPGMQRGMESADFTAKADGANDSETQVAIRSIVTRGTC